MTKDFIWGENHTDSCGTSEQTPACVEGVP